VGKRSRERQRRRARTGPRIEAARRADAECIAAALAKYEARLESKGESVVLVSVVSSGTVLAAVLDALKSCLDANGISAVKVALDDQHYVMEGMP
jgi:hypothetical protein